MLNTPENSIIHPEVSKLVVERERTGITLQEAIALINSGSFAHATADQKLQLLQQLGQADTVIRFLPVDQNPDQTVAQIE